MNIQFQINSNTQVKAIFTSDEYIPLQVKIESSIPSSPEIFHLCYRNQNNLTKFKLGKTFGELHSVTVIFSDLLIIKEQQFNEFHYVTFQMPSYFIFPLILPTNETIQAIDIQKPCTIEIFRDSILIKLPDANQGQFIFYQSENFGVITDQELNVTSLLIKNFTPENRETIIEFHKHRNK